MLNKILVTQIQGNITRNMDLTSDIKRLILETILETKNMTEEELSLMLTSEVEQERELGKLYKLCQDQLRIQND